MEEGKCSSLRVRGGGKVTMISHGVEISIAGGDGEMVRGLSSAAKGLLI